MVSPIKKCKGNVLIVEPNKTIADNLAFKIKSLGYKPITYNFPEEIDEKLIKKNNIIECISEPKFNKLNKAGIEIGKLMHSHGIPTVFLTTQSIKDEEVMKELHEAHAFGYLLKPCKTKKLDVLIEAALEIKKIYLHTPNNKYLKIRQLMVKNSYFIITKNKIILYVSDLLTVIAPNLDISKSFKKNMFDFIPKEFQSLKAQYKLLSKKGGGVIDLPLYINKEETTYEFFRDKAIILNYIDDNKKNEACLHLLRKKK